MKYIAGWNQPGYLPTMEPDTFDNFNDAKEFIIDTLKLVEYCCDTEQMAEAHCHLAEEINLENGPFETEPIDNYVYWVKEKK